MGLRISRRKLCVRTTDRDGRPGIRRQPGRESLFARRKHHCTYWEFDAGAPVRSAITIGPDKGGWLAYFSDRRGNVHAVDVVRGEASWTTHVEDHPAALLTGAPMLAGTTLFVPIASREEVTAT